MPNIKLSGQIKRSFEFMANVNWENLFNNKPVSVNNTMDTDNPKIKTNITRSTVNIDKSKMTTAQVSAIYRESLVLCDNDNIPDTAQTAEEAIEYFGQKIAAYIETFSKEEVEAYAALVETEGANFINEYIQSNPEGPYDINAIFSSFKTKIENIIKEKQELTDKTTEKTENLKNNTDENFDKLMETYENAYGENGYISTQEYAEIIDIAVQYLLGQLLNGKTDDAFFAGINENYTKNVNYNNALTYLKKLKSATNPADIEKNLAKIEEELRSFLGARNVGGSSKIGEAIEERLSQIFYEQCSEKLDGYINDSCEAYSQKDPVPTQQQLDDYTKMIEEMKNAFIAQYKGDIENVEAEFDKYVQQVMADNKEILTITTEYFAKLLTKTGYNELTEALDAAGSYVSDEDEQNIIDKSVEYMIEAMINNKYGTNVLESNPLCSSFANNEKYQEALELLNGLNTSITPKEDYEKARALIKEMLEKAGVSTIKIVMESYEEGRYVSLSEDESVTDGLFGYDSDSKETHGGDNYVILSYTVEDGEIKPWENSPDAADLNKVFDQLEQRIKEKLKEQLDAEYNEEEVGQWIEWAKTAAVVELMQSVQTRGNVSFEVSEIVDKILEKFDEIATLELQGGDYSTQAKQNESSANIWSGISILGNTTLKINLSDDESITNYLWGYNSNDTYGGDDHVVPTFTIENGKVKWTNGNDSGDLNKVFNQLNQRIHDKLKEQLGDKYNKEEIDEYFNRALIEMAMSLSDPSATNTVAAIVDKFLEKFDSIATMGLMYGSEYKGNNILDKVSVLTDAGKMSEYGRNEHYESGKILDRRARKENKEEAQNRLNALKDAVKNSIKAQLGDKYDSAAIDKILNNAISSIVDGINEDGFNPKTLYDNFFNKFESLFFQYAMQMGIEY